MFGGTWATGDWKTAIENVDKKIVGSQRKQEKPTNCGIKAADVIANFLAGQL